MIRKKNICLMLLLLILTMVFAGCSTGGSGSQDSSAKFPTQPVKLLVHTSAGGPTDLMARQIAKAAEPFLGQPIVVENKPGGSGANQMAALLSGGSDGYTLATITPSQIGTWNSNLKGTYGIDSFSYVAGVQIDPYIIVVNAESPYNTLKDLVDDMKNNPNVITVGGYGSVGSGHNVAWSILAEAAGVKGNWTAYESTGDAITALLGKHINVANSNPGQVIQYVEAGELRVLGVMADKRLESMPDVPTYAEAGYTVDTAWAQFRGIYAPAGTPDDVMKTLSDAILKATQTDEFKEYMKNSDLEDGSMDSTAFTEYIKKADKLSVDWLEKLGANQ